MATSASFPPTHARCGQTATGKLFSTTGKVLAATGEFLTQQARFSPEQVRFEAAAVTKRQKAQPTGWLVTLLAVMSTCLL